MRQHTLQAVTLETVATASQAARHAVSAYQLGGQRLLAAIDARISKPAAQRTERYAPRLAAMLRLRSNQAQVLAERGLTVLGQRTGAAISATADGVASQVKRVARLAQGVDSPVLAKGLDAAARFSLPGAQVALALSNRVAAAADKLPVVAKSVGKSAAKLGNKVTKATKTASTAKTSTPRRRVAAQPVVASTQAAVQRVRRSANATVAQAARTTRVAKAAVVQQAGELVDAVLPAKAAKPRKPRASAKASAAAAASAQA